MSYFEGGLAFEACFYASVMGVPGMLAIAFAVFGRLLGEQVAEKSLVSSVSEYWSAVDVLHLALLPLCSAVQVRGEGYYEGSFLRVHSRQRLRRPNGFEDAYARQRRHLPEFGIHPADRKLALLSHQGRFSPRAFFILELP